MLYDFSRIQETNEGFETNHLKVLYYDLKEGFSDIYRSYEYSRVCTILEGEKQVSINNGPTFTYSENDFIYLPPYAHVDMVIPKNTKAVVYELDNHLVHQIKSSIHNSNKEIIEESDTFVKKHDIHSIAAELNRIDQALTTKDPDKGFLIDLITQELVYNMLKNNFIKPTHFKDSLSDLQYILHYIQANLCQPICLSEIANDLHISPSTLTKYFKKNIGLSPKEYVNMLKMKKAKDMLKTQNVTEVCYNLGFEHISHFIHLFKKYYGITPKQYTLKYLQTLK